MSGVPPFTAQTCRGCSFESPHNQPLYQTTTSPSPIQLTPLGALFELCIELPITASDGYPMRICDQCAAMLRVYAEFQKSVRRAHDRFTLYLQQKQMDDDAVGENGAELIEEEPPDETTTEIYLDEVYLNDADEYESIAVQDASDIVEPSDPNGDTSPPIDDAASSTVAEVDEILPTNPPSPRSTSASMRKTKPHHCTICQSRFQCSRALQLHVCATGKCAYACPQCDKHFRSLTACDEHVLRHSAERPFACDQCDRHYKTPNDLHLHRRVHSKQQPTSTMKYHCELCGYGTHNRTQLVHHMNTHAGLRPHACTVCPKRFRRREVLREHMLSMHAAKTQHVCTECNASFGLAHRLARHMAIHTRGRTKAATTDEDD